MTPDVNVLAAASRRDHPQHAPAAAWLDGALADAGRGGRLTVLPMVAAGFLRVATHPRVFDPPTPTAQAVEFVEGLLARPGVEWLGLESEWRAFAALCRDQDLRGNDVPDAWIAAAVLDRHGHLVTFDRGFRRLLPARALTVLDPADADVPPGR